MSVVIGTLCLNEMEWLPKLYEQHRDWPGLRKWVFVESADRMYQQANPELVSPEGLSVDGTTEFLKDLAKKDERVEYVQHGFGTHKDKAQGKCEARQRYMNVANDVRPSYILTLDADEFYTYAHQEAIDIATVENDVARAPKHGIILGYRNIWKPPSLVGGNLFDWEIRGTFWKIVVCKIWKWFP